MGSFRDLQRHRAVIQRMPLLGYSHGFEGQYLELMPDKLKDEFLKFLEEQKKAALGLAVDPNELQYFVPMGYKVPNRLTADLQALKYLLELRSSETVHFTLRRLVFKLAELVQETVPQMTLHLDTTPGKFSAKRGKQDIIYNG